MSNLIPIVRGLQDERTKKVIEEIKELEYKLESKKKKVSLILSKAVLICY